MSPAEAERQRRQLHLPAQNAVADPEPSLPQDEATERHLRLVDGRAGRRANRRHVFVSMAIAGIAVVCLALVGLHVLIAENQFRLDHLEQQAAVQQERYEKLRLQVAQLEAPERIVSVAEGKLGMRQPGSVTYLPATPAPSGAAPQPTSSAPPGDADWPVVKQYLSGSP